MYIFMANLLLDFFFKLFTISGLRQYVSDMNVFCQLKQSFASHRTRSDAIL